MNPQKQNTMKEDTLDPAFTGYWTIHRDRLLREDSEYSAALESYAMKSGADWLLFGIPVVAGIVAMQLLPFESELLRFGTSVLITLIAFVISVYIKSVLSPHRALSDIEADVRRRAYEQWKSDERRQAYEQWKITKGETSEKKIGKKL